MNGLSSIDDALATILDRTSAVEQTESIAIAEADGRVLAQAVHARCDLPGAATSIMDGWAVRADDVAKLRACGSDIVLSASALPESAAGHPPADTLAPGTALRIFTGAVLPAGADAVVAQEDVRTDRDRVRIDRDEADAIVPGRFVRAAGSEVRSGERLLEAGHRLAPGDLALVAATGHAHVNVHRRVRVAIASTGDELVPVGTLPAPGQVVSTNAIVLAAACRRIGADPWIIGDLVDDPGAIENALQGAIASHDVVIVSGGISVGDHDHVGDVLARIGVTIAVRGVALRPGKPTTFGTLHRTLCFALPGNPAASLVTFELFVRPAILRCAGVRGPVTRARRSVRLRAAISGAGRRDHFVRARLVGPDEVDPLSRQLSGDLRSIADFDALVHVPAGVDVLPAGSTATAIVLRELAPREIERPWTNRSS